MTPIAALPTNPAVAASKERAALRQACEEMEGVFLSLLLKQGLKPTLDDGAAAPGHEQAQEYAIEQTARDLGRQGTFGIADQLYEDLSRLL